jgi:hypothetical protein
MRILLQLPAMVGSTFVRYVDEVFDRSFGVMLLGGIF